MREDVMIQAEVTLDAWLYRPDDSAEQRPAIVMSHGLAAVKDLYLHPFAQAFYDAGFVVIVFEHRNYGRSEGTPRLDIDPWNQVQDTRDVISYAQALPFVDADRIGVWGTSFSGGHALIIGAIDKRVGAVVAQVPTVAGYESFRRRTAPHLVAGREAQFAEEHQRLFQGKPATLLPLLPRDGAPGVFNDPAAIAFFEKPESSPPSFEKAMTLLSAERARDYEPAQLIDRIAPTPLLMIVAEDDTVTGSDLSLKAYQRALPPKELVLFKGAHWSPYIDARDQAVAAARDFFERHLVKDAST